MTETTGVFLDVGRTLVDSTHVHATSWWQAYRQLDLDVPMALPTPGADDVIEPG